MSVPATPQRLAVLRRMADEGLILVRRYRAGRGVRFDLVAPGDGGPSVADVPIRVGHALVARAITTRHYTNPRTVARVQADEPVRLVSYYRRKPEGTRVARFEITAAGRNMLLQAAGGGS